MSKRSNSRSLLLGLMFSAMLTVIGSQRTASGSAAAAASLQGCPIPLRVTLTFLNSQPNTAARKGSNNYRTLTSRDTSTPCQGGASVVAFPFSVQGRHPELSSFRGSIPCLHVPLSTLRRRPCARRCMTRGRHGWLNL
jgi:hypothetical protein